MFASLLRRSAAPLAAIAVLGTTPTFGASALRGNVVVDGSSTVYPITEAAAAAFRQHYPNVNVTVAVSGTGGGFKRFTKGETDISDASRPIKAKEFKAAKEAGVSFIELPVALDGLSVVISKQNTWVDQLTVDQLQKIYWAKYSASKKVTWADVKAGWPAKEIKVYSPGTQSGTYDYFKEVVIGKSGESFRADMAVSEDDNVLVTGVSGDVNAIGYFGAAYYFENKDRLKAVPIVNPATGKAVLPEPENVIDGSYAPLSRPLFIYVSTKSLARPEVAKFVEFYLANDDKLATQVGYVSVPDSISKMAEAFVNAKLTGTTYLDKDLQKVKGGLIEAYRADKLTKF